MRIIAVILGAAVIAASGLIFLPLFKSASGTTSSTSTSLVQLDTYLMHDGDTLSSIVDVQEGTYLVVKSDQENLDADVQVSEDGGFVVEDGAVLVLENVNISGTGSSRTTPVFTVYGDMVMNDGSIEGFSSTSSGASSDYGNGGASAICIVDGTFTMNGGSISGNSSTTTEEAAFGGAVRAEGEDASIIINDGTISGNSVLSSASVQGDLTVTANALGGAVAVTEGASITINGGEISDNTAGSHDENSEGAENSSCVGNGGGIAVYSSDSSSISSIYLYGGSILNNCAYRSGAGSESSGSSAGQTHGGGIFSNIYTNAVLSSGTISGNTSDDKGGGLFLDCGRAYGGASFKNTLVMGNTARILGGGLWFCPDGEADMFSVAEADGIALFDNTTSRRGTDGAGDDLYVSPRSGDTGVTVTDTMLGGGSNEWYLDGGALTLEASNSSSRYTASSAVESASLLQASAVVNVPSEEAKQSAIASASVVITDNTATYGGGVGSNHYLDFGTPTDEEKEEHNVPSVTPEPEKISINVEKVWIGDAGAEATVHLFANGTENGSAVLTADSDWSYTFTDLDKTDSEGNEITYTITEDALEGYETSITGDASSGFIVTNTRKISIQVSKVWIGDAGTEATVHLLADGTEAASAVLTAGSGWTYTFTDLDQADSSGNEITYTLTEDEIDGYASEISGDASTGFTVTNTKQIDIQVTKTWIGNEGSEATVHLLADGTEAASAVLTADSGWTYTFTGLDQTDSSGNEITYTLTEDEISGYTSVVTGDASSGFTVTNAEKIDIDVTKVWYGVAGTEATLHLFANGEEIASTTLMTDN
ncbi:MAG: Cna B-type domain-containing protein [Oscillospiraceae bacterium]|jgi:predicted metal-binding protein